MSTYALEIDKLCKTYGNGFRALEDASLKIRPGEFLALLGPNGAGKSTLIGIICSLITKTSGHFQVFGHNGDTEPAQVKKYLGVVPQEFNFNVFEPVIEILVNQAGYYGIDRKVAFARAQVLLKQLKLWDKRRNMARQLSGGMKRRLMIARALMHEPKILILDEPTAGVDIEIRRDMWDFMTQLNHQGTTIILTTHYLEEAEQLCDQVAIIDQGRIIRNLPMQTLLKQIDTQCLILDLQHPVEHIDEIDGVRICPSDALTLEVSIGKNYSINRLFAQLSAQHIEVLAVRNKGNRLEQLFMEMVAEEAA